MREIKFRFFDTEKNYMAYAGPETGLTDGDLLDYGMKAGYPVMQITGLRDKNGVKIFCGDIVDDHIGRGVVEFSDNYGAFKVNYKNGTGKWFIDYNLKGERESIEVIGNIHQSPELLGEKQ